MKKVKWNESINEMHDIRGIKVFPCGEQTLHIAYDYGTEYDEEGNVECYRHVVQASLWENGRMRKQVTQTERQGATESCKWAFRTALEKVCKGLSVNTPVWAD